MAFENHIFPLAYSIQSRSNVHFLKEMYNNEVHNWIFLVPLDMEWLCSQRFESYLKKEVVPFSKIFCYLKYLLSRDFRSYQSLLFAIALHTCYAVF